MLKKRNKLETLRKLGSAAVVIVAIASAAAAQMPPPSETPDIAQELAEVNTSLRRIAELLEQQLASSRLDLMMKRIELTSRRLTPLEAELRSARAERAGLEVAGEDMRIRLENLVEEIDQDQLRAEEAEAMEREAERHFQRIAGELREVDRRIAELESELAAHRSELLDWQEYVDRRLTEF